MQILYLLSSRILNSCWVEFFLHCALWVNGFVVSIQPLHWASVCGLIAFVLSLGSFVYAFFFFLKKNCSQLCPFYGCKNQKQCDFFLD